MSFYLLFLSGMLGGLLGGMGMGGGTLLIPILTLFLGVSQPVAQGVNLLSFLPMSVLALAVHKKRGLLRTRGLPAIILPAVVFSAAGALLASRLPAAVLKKGFGALLLALSVFPLTLALKKKKKKI